MFFTHTLKVNLIMKAGVKMFSVIFDMDGTLLNTQKPFIHAWNYAGEKQGIKDAGKEIPNVCGMNEAGWSAYLKEKFKGIDTDLFNKSSAEYLSENSVTEFKEGANELVNFLKKNNIKIALASGSETNAVNYHLKKLDYLGVFDAIVCGDEIEKGKPEPDIFLLTAKRLGVNPEDCYVLEDSKNGIIAAVRAGMKAIGVPDLVQFDSETKNIMTAEFVSLMEGIEYFKKESCK